ncbi:MAG: prepilin-type N-terminal cleavage/methylation domain-containing protein [Synergistaceae bacterium]|nr:prepilin-type N-terminal cleavage/methylation domain-containing protein [Synergistaceae bacterium]
MGRIRTGFTLAELLIVIIIIGILASVMLLASYTTTDSAKATVLVSNLRNAKAAGIVWLAENMSSRDIDLVSEWTGANMADNLRKHVDSNKIDNYVFFHVLNVGFLIGEQGIPRSVIARAINQSDNLLFDENGVPLTAVGGDSIVCVRVK